MKKLQTLSFHFHWITICCFILPFFYDSCSDERKPEKATVDSTAIVIPVDTISKDSCTKHDLCSDSLTTILSDATPAPTTQKDEFLSEKIIKKYPILKPVLIPATGIHTGLATIVNSIQYLSLFATTTSFLLLLIGLLAKLTDKNAIKIFLLLEILAVVFLLIASPPFLDHDKLWGYWLCIACISALGGLDLHILYKQNKQNT